MTLPVPPFYGPVPSPTLGCVIVDATGRQETKAQPWKAHHTAAEVQFSTDSPKNPIRLQKEGCPIGLGG